MNDEPQTDGDRALDSALRQTPHAPTRLHAGTPPRRPSLLPVAGLAAAAVMLAAGGAGLTMLLFPDETVWLLVATGLL